MKHLIHPHSPYRIFAFSILMTVAAIVGVGYGISIKAMFLMFALIIIELTFSFENAIINAKILQKLSHFWQNIFLTVGIIIAVFGMRIVFPIAIVALTAGLGWREVLDLALNHPDTYSDKLHDAHPLIASFGGAFLLTLALSFFADKSRSVHWFAGFEKKAQKFIPHHFGTPLAAFAIVGLFAALPVNDHPRETLIAGGVGVLVYTAIHTLTVLLSAAQAKRKIDTVKGMTGAAAFSSFLYLELLDASFSFDGVVGAFAITTNVVLIAIGLGVGAIWVRSFTIFMIRRKTLANYIYLEHGAHYTVAVLAFIMLISVLFEIPEVIAGAFGIALIGSSIVASNKARHQAGVPEEISIK